MRKGQPLRNDGDDSEFGEQPGKPGSLNVPDVVIGFLGLLLLPVITLALTRKGEPQAPTQPVAVLGVDYSIGEFLEERDYLQRLVDEHAAQFLIRALKEKRDEKPLNEAEEVAWSRALFERCQRDFEALSKKAVANAAIPEFRLQIEELKKPMTRIKSKLDQLSLLGAPPSATSASSPPSAPSPN